MDLDLPAELSGLAAELRRFAERELRPRAREFEAARAWDDSVLGPLDRFALSGLDAPEVWGGAGAGALAKTAALEAVAYGDAGGLPAADRGGPAIAAAIACPDAEAAARVARACLAGNERAALALGSGQTIAWCPGTSAPRWTWVSEGDALRLLDTSGCDVRPADAGAFHASGGVSVDLRDSRVEGEWALEPRAAADLRGRARLWPAAVAIGLSAASMDYAIAYAKERVVMGVPVAHHQGNAFAIAETAAALDAARLAVRAAAHGIDRQVVFAGLWATLASLDAHEAAARAVDLGVQLLGGHGYVEDHPAEKWFREARMLALLWGGADAALDDARDAALDAPDPVLS